MEPEGGVVIIVPVLGRPHRVQPLLCSIAEATPKPYRVLFVVDSDDFEELHALKICEADYIEIDKPGTYARKINLGARSSTEPLLFSAADDLKFHPGWLDRAVARLEGPVQVVGTNDLGNSRTMSGEHSTHTLFTREYIDTVGGVIDQPPGCVLCELYAHEYCDDEFIQTAKKRGVYAHAEDSWVEHLHYLWGKGQDDATYALGRSRTNESRRTFRLRRRLWA